MGEQSDVVSLYFHGGAFWLMDVASHRAATKKLAKLTKGRCLSVRYRLAPQNPFPSALLDALIAYLYLLYPPADAFHDAVEARHIVFCGDSAGGNLCLALLQILLEFRRHGTKIKWFGESREIPLPAGVAVSSPWTDLTQSSPSCEFNKSFDYLPVPSKDPNGLTFPPCPMWPAKSPRRNFYVEDALLCHPLVSPLAAESWEGSCPMWLGIGQELLADEGKHVACKAARQGVKVVFEEYETMPHCFALVLVGTPVARRCLDGWSNFITAAAERPDSLGTRGVKIKAKSLEEEEMPMQDVSAYTDEEVIARMEQKVRRSRSDASPRL